MLSTKPHCQSHLFNSTLTMFNAFRKAGSSQSSSRPQCWLNTQRVVSRSLSLQGTPVSVSISYQPKFPTVTGVAQSFPLSDPHPDSGDMTCKRGRPVVLPDRFHSTASKVRDFIPTPSPSRQETKRVWHVPPSPMKLKRELQIL